MRECLQLEFLGQAARLQVHGKWELKMDQMRILFGERTVGMGTGLKLNLLPEILIKLILFHTISIGPVLNYIRSRAYTLGTIKNTLMEIMTRVYLLKL